LFKHRTSIPVPLAVALIVIPPTHASRPLFWTGVAVVVAGECLRLWAVAHIGGVSRTRTDRLGPLVDTGPFAWVRNPLYIGNIALWLGFALAAGLPWLAPIFVALLGFEYHAIVRWEEELLESRLGQSYREYAGRVARWMPGPPAAAPHRLDRGFSLIDTLFSERGTLIAVAIGLVLVGLKP
jgi:protein-S-isoprenylcysteine O-methyltransferase Ste14